MSDTPIYDDLVVEREGRQSDAEIAHALAAWRPGEPLPFSEHDEERLQ